MGADVGVKRASNVIEREADSVAESGGKRSGKGRGKSEGKAKKGAEGEQLLRSRTKRNIVAISAAEMMAA